MCLALMVNLSSITCRSLLCSHEVSNHSSLKRNYVDTYQLIIKTMTLRAIFR